MHVVATTYLVPSPFAATYFLFESRQPDCASSFPPGNGILCNTRMYCQMAWGEGETFALDAIWETYLWCLSAGSQQGAGKEGIAFIHFSVTVRIDPPTAAFMPGSTRSELC